MKQLFLLLPTIGILYLLLSWSSDSHQKAADIKPERLNQRATNTKPSITMGEARRKSIKPVNLDLNASVVVKSKARETTDTSDDYITSLKRRQGSTLDQIANWLQTNPDFVESSEAKCEGYVCEVYISYSSGTTEEQLAEFYHLFWSLEGENQNLKKLEVIEDKEGRVFGFRETFFESEDDRLSSTKGERFDIANDIIDLSGALETIAGDKSPSQKFLKYTNQIVETGLDSQFLTQLDSYTTSCSSRDSCKLEIRFLSSQVYDEREYDLLREVFDIVAEEATSKIAEYVGTCDYNVCEYNIRLN